MGEAAHEQTSGGGEKGGCHFLNLVTHPPPANPLSLPITLLSLRHASPPPNLLFSCPSNTHTHTAHPNRFFPGKTPPTPPAPWPLHCRRYDERLDLFTLYYRLAELNRLASAGAPQDEARSAVLPGWSAHANLALAVVVESMRRVVGQGS